MKFNLEIFGWTLTMSTGKIDGPGEPVGQENPRVSVVIDPFDGPNKLQAIKDLREVYTGFYPGETLGLKRSKDLIDGRENGMALVDNHFFTGDLSAAETCVRMLKDRGIVSRIVRAK
jgi:hypothetical protein